MTKSGTANRGADTLADLQRIRIRSITISMAVSVLLLAVKFVAYALTGSAAIYSDALESIIDVVAGAFACFSIWLSARPADPSHPYGHGKVEFMSVGVEGTLIGLAAMAILYKAVPALFNPEPLPRLGLGLTLIVFAGVAKSLLAFFLIHTGRRTQSLPLEANGRHMLTDAITTAGVIVGLGVVKLTGWWVCDPLIACGVAVNILFTGGRLIRKSVGGLMDEADPQRLERIAGAFNDNRPPEWIDVHQLRTWRSGVKVHTDFHLTLPRYWNLKQAHAAMKEAEKQVVQALGSDAEAIIHMDPCREYHCPTCRIQDCPDRAAPLETPPDWSTAALIKPPPHKESSQAQETQPTTGAE